MLVRAVAGFILLTLVVPIAAAVAAERPPNVLLVITDDLGYAEVGCYGQKKIQTPNIDALAKAGMRFTDAYSGSCVCAPARCALLTGLHTGHCAIRDNKEIQPEGQQPLPSETATIATILKRAGYATAAIGKWGLGPPGSSGDPDRHGFDHFFGYLCQRHAHNHCPPYLWRNHERVPLEGNVPKNAWGPQYAPDLMRAEAETWLRAHREKPWFLLFATPVPHVALQAPPEAIAQYSRTLVDQPYDGKKGYLPHETPHAAYAAMVTRMDEDFGRLLARLEEWKLVDDTIVIFTSDNGPTWAGGADSAYFESTGGLRGLKGQLYEGGIRVPLIVRWPGQIKSGSLSAFPCASWDFLPTFCDILKIEPPPRLDGVSLLPTWTGIGPQAEHKALYWEYASEGGWQAVRMGQFKGVRRQLRKNPDAMFEVYDLQADPSESKDIASRRPDIVAKMQRAIADRTPAILPEWNSCFSRNGE